MELPDVIPLESWSDYTLLECIGEGAYSTVWEAKHVPTGTMVAIKLEEVVFADITTCKRILREIKLLRQLAHPNIVKLIDLFMKCKDDSGGEVYLVLELIDTDLRQLIKAPSYLSEKQIKCLFYGVLLGIKYIQSAGVLHRDIKPANILITKNCQGKICDFGLARTVLEVSPPSLCPCKKKPKGETVAPVELEIMSGEEEKTEKKRPKYHLIEIGKRLTAHVVSRWYRAPEVVLMQKDYGYGIDIWAAGCLFAELQAMKKENVSRYQDRRPLFPGTACYPLSPKGGADGENHDQLNVILDVIGTPKSEDCGFISEKEMVQMLMNLPKKPKKNYAELYPGSEKHAIDLLDRMLQFDPYKRIEIDECLKHPYFASIQKKEREISAAEKIVLEFVDEGTLNADIIRKMFMEEVEYFTKQRKEGKLFK